MSVLTLSKDQEIQYKDPDRDYTPLPTMHRFHEDNSVVRCLVGPVGSGKTSAAVMEIVYFLPRWLAKYHKVYRSRWVVLRNTYVELMDTTKRTIQEWCEPARWTNGGKDMKITVGLPGGDEYEVELLLRSCDRPEDLKKFKSLEVTGYWIDESIEVAMEIKNMLKNRIGRFPPRSPEKYGIETTNPPDIEEETYWIFKWDSPPPGPLPDKDPLKEHTGFWQPPGENAHNLPRDYYNDLREFYRATPDWIDMYIDGKPGLIIRGKLVYNNFDRQIHVATHPLRWVGADVEPGARMPDGATIYVGWDNSGNTPAAVAGQVPSAFQLQILREFWSDKMNIVDFANYVMGELAQAFPGCHTVHWGDPAGENTFSTKDGGFTSNARLMREGAGVQVRSADNNFQARIEAVEYLLARRNGILIDPGCRRLQNGFLGGYVYPENRSIVGEYLPNVLKNKYSHVHDALQYMAVKLFKFEKRGDIREPAALRRHRQRTSYRSDDEKRAEGYDPRNY